jgi:16S rRNA (cytosine967-C5)-methyltransferase
VTALDLSDRRLGRLRDNLARTGLSAEVVAGDVMAFDRGGWDAILLDAPCSATGTIRRHPELPLLRDGSGMAELIGRQAALIDHALGLLRPGGRLVFCTCSLLPEEGEVQAAGALGRHAGLRADAAAAAALPGVDPGWITAEGGLRLRPDVWPEAGGMDGFFMVLLRKPA